MKAKADKAHATPADRAVAFAATKGYAFTADEVKAYAKAKQLTDADLEGVTGGAGDALSWLADPKRQRLAKNVQGE